MRLNVFNKLMGLCVATAAVSCSNDEVIDGLVGGKESDMISFVVAEDTTRGGSLGNRPDSSTRGAVTTTDNITNNSFAVFGEQTPLNSSDRLPLFNNEKVSYDNGEWTYSNLRYWFPDYEYSFMAFYPTDAIPVGKSSNDIISKFECVGTNLSFTYTHPSDYSKTQDILIAGHRRQCLSSSSAKPVEFNFGHILTRVNFVAFVDNEIEIKNITITGLSSEASFSVQPDVLNGSSQTSDLTGNQWSDMTGSTSASKDTNKDNVETKTDKSISLFPNIDPLLVLPQKTEYIKVEVKYQQGSKLYTIEGDLKSTSITTWLAGKAYTYSFTITNSDYIVFLSPEVENWFTDDGGSYIIMD